ncbi:hypothetical protein [Amycolatopsis sp. Hca4]|uniref:hypothetical protein n=1 Tax=Amycolatopsis sp. Hca4 TaxID=2742131 RepID=UPI00159283F3|nr:hypothetical protein [Amycolatopsis sp. Hca4]QKV74513.1 hypothetical protein HUT10_12605 [Amycolatopsis sp. Hca4]
MNITEANDTNRVLRYLLDLRQGVEPARDDDVRDAALRLSARINKALHAGITPSQVGTEWEIR